LFSNKILIKILPLLLLLLNTAACQETGAAADISQAVQEGLLISPEAMVAGSMAFTTVEAQPGRMVQYSDISLNLHFPLTVDLSFERSGGRLSYRNATNMQFVEEGEILFSVRFDEDALRVEEQQLTLRMNDAERRHNSERSRRRQNITDFRGQTSADLSELEQQIRALRLEALEADYQELIRQFQVQRRDQNRQLDEIRSKLQGEDIVAPFDSVIVWADPIRLNSVIENWMILVTLYDYRTFRLEGRSVPGIFRHGDIVDVEVRGRSTQQARIVSDPLTQSGGAGHNYTFILESINPYVDASYFYQRNLSANPVLIEAEGIIVPTRAIHSEDNRRYVYIYEDGVIRKRYVRTGFFYMGTTQILDGIDLGQLVVLH